MTGVSRDLRRRNSLIVCWWPGLARIWYRGEWSALFIAFAFAMLLNLALVASFVWTQWPSEGFPQLVWPVVGFTWLVSFWHSRRSMDRLLATPKTGVGADDTLFIQAQTEYLRGSWADAQTLLETLLERRPRDSEARLLLATLLRHSRRLTKARQQLEILERFDESLPWQFEINRERELLKEIENESVVQPPDARPQDKATRANATEATLSNADAIPDGNQGDAAITRKLDHMPEEDRRRFVA